MIESNRERVSPDGRISPEAASLTFKNLAAFEDTFKNAKIDLAKTYDNSFVERAPEPALAITARRNWNEQMKRSTDRILTTHVGSLPRPDDLFELMLARMDGKPVDESRLRRTSPQGGRGQRQAAGRRRARRGQRRRDGQAELHHLRLAAPRRSGEARGHAAEPILQHARDPRFSGILPVPDRRAGLGPPAPRADDLHRADCVQGPRPAQGRSRHAEGCAEKRQRVTEAFVPAIAPSNIEMHVAERVLSVGREIRVRHRRGDARGIQGDRRRRLPAADRRSVPGHLLHHPA